MQFRILFVPPLSGGMEIVMKKTIYAVSDIHGYCTELEDALHEAGFVINDDRHLLIVCGDCFDRGEESKEVFDFLNSVKNKILIRGNHEDMLEALLEQRLMGKGGFTNGIDCTLRSFFGDRVIGMPDIFYGFSYKLHFEEKEDTVEQLKAFINHTYDYFETEHYIFTHGWLPVDVWTDGTCAVRRGFRHDRPDVWYRARITEWYRAYGAGATLKGKTVVCGHRSARFGCLIDYNRNPADCSIFTSNGIAVLDASTMQSGNVNVLVIENETVDSVTHEMTLNVDPFQKIQKGEKRVELRLMDEKRRKIRVGDRIVFRRTESEETVCVRVLGLHAYRNFDEVTDDFSDRDLGFENRKKSLSELMRTYYSDSDVEKYSVLAIRIMTEKSENEN